QRHSPWGISDGDFSRGFRGLLEALWRQLPERLWIEADDRRRERLFAFPAQFATLAAPLEGLLETLLPSGEQGPRLAGVYFASAFQQDGTQNRLFPDPTEDKKPKLSLPRQQRRYFMAGLPAALASRQQPRRKGRLALRAAVAGLLVILALAGYGWERLYLQRVAQSLAVLQAAARDLPSTPADPLAVLSLLEAARRMPHQDPLARGLGGVTDNLYPRLLQKLLIPRLRGQLEEELQPRLLEQDPVRGLIALEAYRALGSQGRGEALLDWWRGHPRRDPALDNHLNSLLELLPLAPLSLDQAHLARARRYLEEMDTAQRLYAQLRQECLEEVLDHFEPAALDPTGVFTSPRARPGSRGERIPGCFTREGLLSHLPDRSTIQRVLREQGAGSTASADLDRLLDKVRLAYLEDYVAHWQGLLTNLELAQLTATDPADFNRSLGVLERLADPGVSPLLQLLAALDDHLHIEPSSVRQVDDDPSDLVEQRLNDVFSGLHWAARVDNMTSLLRLLAQLGGRLKALAVDDGPIDPVVREAALAAVRDLQRYANYQPRPLERWLGDLADDSRDLVIRDQAAQLNQLLNEFWFDDVLRPCRLGIQGRYPLAPPGAPEASLGDFGGFFGPDGAMAVFFRQYLAEFVDTTRQPWQWRSGSGYGRPALSSDSLALFQRAAAIREGFFSGPDNRPRMLFELEALPGGDRVVLMLDGQRVELQPDGSRPYALEWPAPAMAGVSLSAPGAEPFRQWHGPWGWLALLQEADLTLVAGPWPYQAGLRQVGREILFQLRPEAEHDPFALIAADTLMGFSCPGRL
ncbi:MAG: ImcF-related family protein, partial [Candidatus Competibacteraceae bacterium]|nr:ImcF-related family protein [Candidatus Competibacteraceae bacterium]